MRATPNTDPQASARMRHRTGVVVTRIMACPKWRITTKRYADGQEGFI